MTELDPVVVRRLLRARDRMDRDFARPLDVPKLARVAGASEAHFARLFKRAFGVTPRQYLIGRRIERAMDLLRRGDVDVTEVCLRVGFVSLGSFSTAFHRLVGETPSAYRARWSAAEREALGRIPSCHLMAATRVVKDDATRAGFEKPDEEPPT